MSSNNKWIKETQKYSKKSGKTYKDSLSDPYNSANYYNDKINDVFDYNNSEKDRKDTSIFLADCHHEMNKQIYSLEILQNTTRSYTQRKSLENMIKDKKTDFKNSLNKHI